MIIRRACLGFVALSMVISPAFGASSDDLTADDQSQMYSQIVEHLLGPDDTYGGPISAGKVYVNTKLTAPSAPDAVKKMDEGQDSDDVFFTPWPKATRPATQEMSDQVQSALEKDSNLSQYKFQWVSDVKALKRDPKTGALPDGRPTLALTQLVHLSPDRVYAVGVIFVASEVSGMCLYIFKKDSSGWHFEKRIQGPTS